MRMMIRTAAVPVSALADLRYDVTWPSVARAAELDGWLRIEGPLLVAELHDVIGGVTGQARSALVALRRAIYSQRYPSERAWNAEVRTELSADLAGRVESWACRLRLHRDLMAELPVTLEREQAAVTARLRERLRTPAFRYGLAQGSPVLSEQLGKWLDGDATDTPQRQSVLRLVKYLARAAAKTSPYSTFTISGLVPPVEGAGMLTTGPRLRWTSAVELNIWLLRRILRPLVTGPRHRGSLQVRPNPSLVSDDGRYRFLSVADGATVAGMRRGAGLDACIVRAADPGGCTVDDLYAHLLALNGALDGQKVRDFVNRVIEPGVLCLRLPFPDQVDNHLAAFADWLDSRDVPDPAGIWDDRQIVAGLRELDAALAGYPALVDVRARERVRTWIGGQVVDLLRRVDAPDPEMVPRKNVFHENAVFTEPAAGFAPEAWSGLVEQLATVRRVLCAIDPAAAIRAAVSDLFVARYGPGGRVGWLDFYQGLNAAMAGGGDLPSSPHLAALWAGPTMTDPAAWWQLPYARELAARIDAVTELIFARASTEGPEVVLTEPELASRLGLATGPQDSVTCYGQLADLDRTGVPRGFVLNGAICGYGRGLSNVHRMLRMVGVADRFPSWRPTERGPGGELLVELDNLFGSNLNLRSQATRFELDYPLTTPDRDQAERIPLRDLEVVHDPVGDRLRLRARGLNDWLRPIHGGMMATLFLPEPMHNLITLFGPTHTLLHPGVPLFVPRGGDLRASGIRRAPRVRFGDVVLSRRAWVLPTGLVPRRCTGESDASYWARLAGWHQENNLPERYYVRAVMHDNAGWEPVQKSRKPTYVDLACWHLVALLERGLAAQPEGRAGPAARLFVLTEALPEPVAAPRYGAQRHVTELVVELPGEPGASA